VILTVLILHYIDKIENTKKFLQVHYQHALLYMLVFSF